MATFVYLFKNDIPQNSADVGMTAWNAFIVALRNDGHFIGGGPFGEGCVRTLDSTTDEISNQLSGYMVITAEDLDHAEALLDNCPTIRFGGSVEIRCIPEE